MDLSYTPEYLAYQDEVRRFLASEWPKRPGGNKPDAAAIAAFRLKAVEAGYLYRNIPRQYGGSEQAPDVLKAQIIEQEFKRARAPLNIADMGVAMLVPTLLELGTPEQKDRFIGKTVSGEYVWAQGYSEPGSGSDLASVRTRGELVDGQWIINGQKVWSTRAHRANYMFALIKTEPDAPKHHALSYILLDLRQPGVTIRPLRQMTGGSEFCEVFFDNAVAPVEWTVGKRGEGWQTSRSTLKHERNYIGGAERSGAQFERLLHLAKNTQRNGKPVLSEPQVRQRLAQIASSITALRYSSVRQVSMIAAGQDPGLFPMLAKLYATNIGHEMAHTARDLIGDSFMLAPPPENDRRDSGSEKWNIQYMGSVAVAIAGGTSNIQRNIIAERGLGLRFRDGKDKA